MVYDVYVTDDEPLAFVAGSANPHRSLQHFSLVPEAPHGHEGDAIIECPQVQTSQASISIISNQQPKSTFSNFVEVPQHHV